MSNMAPETTIEGMDARQQAQQQQQEHQAEYPPPSLKPSDVAPPTKVNEARQQASTSPGDGSEVQASESVDKPSFGEQVIGYAKITRGTLLGKPETKEHGEKILEGEASPRDPNAPLHGETAH